MRAVLGVLALAVLAVAAGCGANPVEVGVEPTASVTEAGDDYRVTVAIDPEADADYTYRNLRVVGLGPDGDPVCTARFGDVDADGSRMTETVTCDRIPLAFVPRSANASGGGPDDVYVSHERLALVDANASGWTYEPVRGPLPDGPVAYSKCVLRRDGADPDAFAGTTPWLEWERLEPEVERGYGLAADNRTGYAVYSGANGHELEPIALPSGSETEPLRELLDRAAAEDASPGQVIEYDRSVTRDRLLALLDALHDRNVATLEDVPATEVNTSRADPDRHPPAHAAGIRFDDRRISCRERAMGAYVGGKGVSVTYAVRHDGKLFIVRAGGGVRWSGPAFAAPSG